MASNGGGDDELLLNTSSDALIESMNDSDYVASFKVIYRDWVETYRAGPDSYAWILSHLHIEPDNVSFATIDQARNVALNWLYHMYRSGVNRGLISTATETGAELIRMYAWTRAMVYWSCNSLTAMEMARMTSRLENVLPPFEFSFERPSMEVPEGQELSDFHKVLVFILHECQRENLRKIGDQIYAQVQTEAGNMTHAWKQVCSIRTFVYERVDKETRFEQWFILSKSPNMVDRLVKWLSENEERELQSLKPNRYYISFSNGVYDIERDAFLRYGDARLTHEVVSCRFIDKHMDESLFRRPYLKNPAKIPTPTFDRILLDQGLEDTVIVWIFALLGRMLYYLNHKDRWQKILFIQGKGGTGKSTIAGLLRSIYEPSQVGVLNSNCEAQWALSSIYNSYMWICFEVKKNFRLDTASLQSIVVGEPTVINKKREHPFSVDWNVPGMLMGNELPISWVDSQGALVRRILMVRFEKKPPRIDPMLNQKIRSELPNILVKMNRMYHAAISKFGDEDLTNYLPPYFTETQQKFQKQSQPLRAMLTSEKDIEIAAHRYMMLDEIKEAFNLFCRLNNLPPQQYQEDNFNYVFEDLGLRMESVSVGIEYNDRVMYGAFVFGVGLTEGGGDTRTGLEAYMRRRVTTTSSTATTTTTTTTTTAATGAMISEEARDSDRPPLEKRSRVRPSTHHVQGPVTSASASSGALRAEDMARFDEEL